jgi:hypothetical protein
MVTAGFEDRAAAGDDRQIVLVLGDGDAAECVGKRVALPADLWIVDREGFEAVEGFAYADISRREEHRGDIEVARGNVAPINSSATLVGRHRRGTAKRYEGEKHAACGGKDVDESTNHADSRTRPANEENAPFTNRQPTSARATLVSLTMSNLSLPELPTSSPGRVSVTAGNPPSGSESSNTPESWRMTAAPAVLLLVQSALYVWMAPRGFEFTDESYYLLNYLYWRDLTATVSFFGAYFELPFRLLGQSIFAIRVFSLVGLLVASGFFTREALRFSSKSEGIDTAPLMPFVVVGIAASLFYFGYFSSVRAASYNLLALCTMLIATGLLLRLAMRGASRKQFRVTGLCYGVAVGACGLDKAPTGALIIVLHAMFFALASRDWRGRRLLELSFLILAGVALNFVLLQWAHPSWLSALREGVAITNTVGHGGLFDLARAMMRDVWSLAPSLLEWSIVAAAIIVLARNIRHNRRAQISIAVVALVCGCALELVRSQDRYLWLPIVGLSALVLWTFEMPWRKPSQWTRVDAIDLGFTCLLFVLPLAFSFGTNMPVFAHSQMAAVFGIVALLIRLQRLADQRQITKLGLIISLTVLAVPTFVIQLQNTFDPQHAYRLRTALIDQTLPARVGLANTRLLLDSTTRDLLVAVNAAGRAAGFTAHQEVLDLTGDGPGLIYALGGRPLGVVWLPGGYPGSQITAARLISRLPLGALQGAWLLTSSTNPRRIVGWQRMLDERLGAGAHEWVATVRMRSPYGWYGKAPEPADVDIWRPRVTSGSVDGQ